MDKLKMIIESVFLDLIKHVGDSEHIYYGTPAEMIDKLITRIKADKDIKERMTCANCGFVFDYYDDGYGLSEPTCPKCGSNACDDPEANWTQADKFDK